MLWGFSSLGFLVGNLTGLGADSLIKDALSLLLAAGAGSAIAVAQKMSQPDRKYFGKAILLFSVWCVIGTYSGILVTEHQLLSPSRKQTISQRESIEARKYLREQQIPKALAIDNKLRNGEINLQRAYSELLESVTTDNGK